MILRALWAQVIQGHGPTAPPVADNIPSKSEMHFNYVQKYTQFLFLIIIIC